MRSTRQAGAAQVKGIGNAIGSDAGGSAGCCRRIDGGKVFGEAERVIGAGNADVNTARATTHPGRHNARILKRLPGHFQQQALLRIHLRRFARRNTKKSGVEAENITDGAGRKRVAGAAVRSKRMPESLFRPAIRGNLGDQIFSGQ
jgi:hypothetical protein